MVPYRKFTHVQQPEIEKFSAGAGHSLILNHKGNLMVTGKNSDGQLGTGNFRNQNTFLDNNVEKVIDVFAGAKNSYLLLSNGKLLGVGDNDLYQLADGTSDDKSKPVEVGNEAIPPKTPTPTPTPTPTYNEFDSSLECEVTLDYLLSTAPSKDGNSSFAKFSKTQTMNPFSVETIMQFELASTHINEGKHLKVKDLELSTEKTSPFLVEILDQEIIPPIELDYVGYEISQQSYDYVLYTNTDDTLESALQEEYKAISLFPTIIALEDLIENENLIDELGGDNCFK